MSEVTHSELLKRVETLLRTTSELGDKPSRSWLTLKDARDVLVAVTHDASEVYLVGMGRMFSIKYRENKIWLSPADNKFTPCGWFEPKKLQQELDDNYVLNAL